MLKYYRYTKFFILPNIPFSINMKSPNLSKRTEFKVEILFRIFIYKERYNYIYLYMSPVYTSYVKHIKNNIVQILQSRQINVKKI